MKTIPTLTLLSFLALPAALRAQTADGFDTSGMVSPPTAAEGNAKPAPAARTAPAPAAPAAPAMSAAEVEVLKKTPSRYAGTTGPELAAYVEAYASRFAIRRSQTDVFGRFQDPTAPVALPTPKSGNQGPVRPQIIKVPFSDVVAAIEVNTIDLAKKRFLVGSREFRVGSVLNLKLPTGGKYVKAQVTAVSSQTIAFRNPETGETAAKRMETMPSGMSRGTSDISAPGMQRTGDNAPLEVEVAPPSPPISYK